MIGKDALNLGGDRNWQNPSGDRIHGIHEGEWN